jgi:hypothetical protein
MHGKQNIMFKKLDFSMHYFYDIWGFDTGEWSYNTFRLEADTHISEKTTGSVFRQRVHSPKRWYMPNELHSTVRHNATL